MKRLTARQKLHKRNIFLERDGTKCLYCKLELNPDECVIDHLNNVEYDNNDENLVLCHQSCNLEKRNSPEYQLIANEKLEFNQKHIFTQLEDKSQYGNSPEIEHNVNVRQYAKQFLQEKVMTDGKIEYSDILDGLTYLCSEKFGHCSQVSIRRHLDALCSSFGPFMKIKNEFGKFIIVKRSGN